MKKILLILTMLFITAFTFSEEKVLKIGDQFPNVLFMKSPLDTTSEKTVSFLEKAKNMISGTKEIEKNELKEIRVSDLKGKKVLINFTASWCPFCQIEKDRFSSDYTNFLKDNKAIETIVVFGDYGKETPATAANYMKIKNHTFPYYYDSNKVILQEINLKKVPQNYLLDETGKIIDIQTYYYDIEALKPYLQK